MKYFLIIIVSIIQVSARIKLELRYTESVVRTLFDVNGHIKNKFMPTAILEHSEKDIVVSPLPILTAVAFLSLGASKRNLHDLEAAIGYTREGIMDDMKSLIQVSIDHRSLVLLSDKMFISSRFDIKKDYVNMVKNLFHRKIEKIQFTSNDAACRINKWIHYSGQSYIEHGITESEAERLSGILLLTAASYMCRWQTPFQWSEKDTFYTNDGPIKVDMMYLKTVIPYSDDNNFESQIIILPVMDVNIQVILILPKHREGLYSVVKSLQEYGLNVLAKDINNMEWVEVEVYLPKFSIATVTELSSAIKKIGLECIFKPPGLMEMVEGQTVTVNSVLNVGVIDMNEEGIGPTVKVEPDAYKKPIQLYESTYKGKQVKVKYPFFFLVKSGEEQIVAGVYNGKDGQQLFEGPTETNSNPIQYNDNCPDYNFMQDLEE